MPTATDIPLYVLAGGQSSRFGSDKAVAEVGGVPMLQRVIDRLQHKDQEVTIVTGEDKRYEWFGHAVITDQPAGIGPLGGLAAALHHRRQYGMGWLLLTSCDLVDPERAWAEQLDAHRESVPSNAIAFRGAYWEPMFALYHTKLLPLVARQIEQGHHSMQSLLDATEAVAIELPAGLEAIPQANTPEQLKVYCNRSVA